MLRWVDRGPSCVRLSMWAHACREIACVLSWAPAAASFGDDGRVHGTPTYLVGLRPLLSLSRVSSRLGAFYP